jgi:fructan beta-fructosidase
VASTGAVVAFALILVHTASASQTKRDDILIADFESETYGKWKLEGHAFGPAPARGTLPNQMAVSGFLGERLVNSYYDGDGSTGRLTSPPFRIEREFINFLIGGGKYPTETFMQLLVDGKAVRTATGLNDQPGGNERLEWQTWPVREFAGRTATIEIVDTRTGGWGHINVDQITQSDSKRTAELMRRAFVVEKRYLQLPVKTGAVKRQMRFRADGQTVREFEIELADGAAPDFWVFSDVAAFLGKQLAIEVELPGESKALDTIAQVDSINSVGSTAAVYSESRRPQFHFTSRRGWLNDPNGLVHYKGEYHLFYQHNPYGWDWGNMHWGHAVSNDLIRWKELPIALYPQKFGDWCFSGSAVVDRNNTSGFKRGDDDVLIAAYTSTARGESIVSSTDRGRTWTEYDGNPVVRHSGRDPKLLWHEPTQRWVMAVYDELGEKKYIAFHTSPDLKQWEFQSRIEGFYECPDLIEMAIHGKAAGSAQVNERPAHSGTKWVLYAADGRYVIGDFDGRRFVIESGPHQLWFGNFYAAQTYSNAPDDRTIQIGWGRGITFPGMPFNQQMTIPVELTLRLTEGGVRMFAEPVGELASLRGRSVVLQDVALGPGVKPLDGVHGETFDVQVEFDLGNDASAKQFGLTLRGVSIEFDRDKRIVTCGEVSAPLNEANQRIRLRVLVDRGSIEVFGNGGAVAISAGTRFPDDARGVSLFSRGGTVGVRSLEAFELRSAWE